MLPFTGAQLCVCVCQDSNSNGVQTARFNRPTLLPLLQTISSVFGAAGLCVCVCARARV